MWIKNLIEPLENDPTGLLAGVYGHQEPLSSSSALDKRDLTVVFGLDEIQKKIAFLLQIALSEEICGKNFRLMKQPPM